MQISTHIPDIRHSRWLEPTVTWGLVPTMGYLHNGHLSLVKRARAENDRVGVSIFVNPTQFNNANDLTTYPRSLERDLALLEEAGVDLVWTPTPEVAYPQGYQSYITVEEVTLPLEGASRPGHFKGVATIVAKLFNVFQPTRAYFGQKDAQQIVVIKQMVRDLNFNLEIVACPIERNADGLAMSSRNANLSPEAREQATCLYHALSTAREAIQAGERNADQLRAQMRSVIEQQPLAEIDYVSVADNGTLQELTSLTAGEVLLSMAVYVGGVRLIDNAVVTP